jgi:hypothetical protein
MYKKVFSAVIDEDSVPLISIELDGNGTDAKDPGKAGLLDILSKNPTVVELNGISPKFGTAWDGSAFEEFTNSPIMLTSPNPENEDLTKMKHFSLVVDGKHSSVFGINTITSEGEMIAAGLSSNPVIVGNIVS